MWFLHTLNRGSFEIQSITAILILGLGKQKLKTRTRAPQQISPQRPPQIPAQRPPKDHHKDSNREDPPLGEVFVLYKFHCL